MSNETPLLWELVPARDIGPGYFSLVAAHCEITIEARPSYCDRGNWIAKIFRENPITVCIDGQDGWPRYYFDLERAKLECEAWLRKRKLI